MVQEYAGTKLTSQFCTIDGVVIVTPTHSVCAESVAQLDHVSLMRTLVTQALATLNSLSQKYRRKISLIFL